MITAICKEFMLFRSKIKKQQQKHWYTYKEGWKTKSLRGVVPLRLVVNVGWSALWRTSRRIETQTEKQSTIGQFTMGEDNFNIDRRMKLLRWRKAS